MSSWVKRAVIVAVCVVSGLVAFYAYLSLNARQIFHDHISMLTQRHVEVHSVKAEFPNAIVIKGLSIEGVLTCERVKAVIDLTSLLGNAIRIPSLEIDGPVVTWHKPSTAPLSPSSTDKSRSPAGQQPGKVPGMPVPPAQAALEKSVILAHALVRNGVLKVETQDASAPAREYLVERIELRADNAPLTDTPARTGFFVTASLARLNVPFVGHFLKASGWLNWAARDMEGVAQVIDDDGRVGLDVKMVSLQNNMAVFGTMKLSGDQGAQAMGQKSGLTENVILSALGSTKTDIVADFSFKTKMDKFEFNAVHLSGHITTGLNSSATSGNIVAGLKAAGEELFKAPDVSDVVK